MLLLTYVVLTQNSFLTLMLTIFSCLILLQSKHLLMILLYLEGLGLLLLISLTFLTPTLLPSQIFIFLIFVFMVCEAAAGLGVLVSFSRTKTPYLTNLSLFKLM